MADVFPSIRGKNLNKRRLTVPDDFSGKNLIVIVAFQRWHQPHVDATFERFEATGLQHTHHIIEVPVLANFSRLRQMRLDGVMRAGIQDRTVRERTITVYLDKARFRAEVGISDESSIHWFVIRHDSNIVIQRGEGIPSSKEVEHITANSV